MALPINIANLINDLTVENTRIEYKSEWNPEPILHSICAFANDIDNLGGGYIIIGISEINGMPKFPIKGIKKNSIDHINKELLQLCNLIEPRYLPLVEPYIYKQKNILVVWVPGGACRPYKCPTLFTMQKSARTDKSYYIRKMSNTIKANASEVKELYSLSESIPFDDRVNLKANVADLKPSLISEYLHSIGSDLYHHSLERPLIDIAMDLRIAGGSSEIRKPINIGLMMFNDRPEDFFSYAHIEIIDKPEATGIGMTEKIFSGPLDRQLKDALSFISNYIIKEKIIKVSGQAEAKRIFNIPYDAIEEALSNAIYHKSYQIREPITVTLTPSRMEITSLPGPDRTISDEALAKRKLISRRYRNRRIGDFLKELHLIEGRNTGVPTMIKAMKDNGSPMPDFLTDEERSYFTVVLYVHDSFISEQPIVQLEKQSGKRRNRADIKNLIIETLKANGEMSRMELSATIGYKKPSAAFMDITRELINKGIIGYTQKDNLHSRNQKLKLL